MYYDGSQDFELEEDKLYVDFVFFCIACTDDMLMILIICFTNLLV